MTCTHRSIVIDIAAAALAEVDVDIAHTAIDEALEQDRAAGFSDPSPEEVELLVSGDEDGNLSADLRAAHPALDALLDLEMT